jgi:hypothetical protein
MAGFGQGADQLEGFLHDRFQLDWGFKTNRDYLLPIQERMLTLTGNQWVQNPGW